MSDHNYEFFIVFSKIDSDFESETEKSKFMVKSKTIIIDAIRETGMLDRNYDIPIERDNNGIGMAGANRTFSFRVYVYEDAIINTGNKYKNAELDVNEFDPDKFVEEMEKYIHTDHYDWTQSLTSDDIFIGRASEIKNKFK